VQDRLQRHPLHPPDEEEGKGGDDRGARIERRLGREIERDKQ
jgi:hypothetical protein